MAEATEKNAIGLSDVQELLTDKGYEVQTEGDQILRVREVDSGIVIRSVLEDNILFNAVTCMVVSSDAITPEVMRKMLAADNGIATSNFQLYERPDGQVAVTLNNFCKLQEMGPDDADDILSCLEFLEIDAYAARDVVGQLA